MKSMTKSALALGTTIAATAAANALRHLSAEDVLGSLGLTRRHGGFERALSAVGLVAVGATIGAGVALMLAPSSGQKLRAQISDRLDDAKESLQEAANSAAHVGGSSSNHRATHS